MEGDDDVRSVADIAGEDDSVGDVNRGKGRRLVDGFDLYGYRWEVLECAEGDVELGSCIGMCVSGKMRLLIKGDGVCTEVKRHIFMHEFVHGVLWMAGYHRTSPRAMRIERIGGNEVFVQSLASGLGSVFERGEMEGCDFESVRLVRVLGQEWAVERCFGGNGLGLEPGSCVGVDFPGRRILAYGGLDGLALSYGLAHACVHVVLCMMGWHRMVREEPLVYGLSNAFCGLFRFRDGVLG